MEKIVYVLSCRYNDGVQPYEKYIEDVFDSEEKALEKLERYIKVLCKLRKYNDPLLKIDVCKYGIEQKRGESLAEAFDKSYCDNKFKRLFYSYGFNEYLVFPE